MSVMSVSPYNSPQWPDLHVCSQAYGQDLRSEDCLVALSDSRFRGTDRTTYVVGPGGQLFSVPFGNCIITVELSGPTLPIRYSTTPILLKSLATWVISQCVMLEAGLGGFVTYGLDNLVQYTIYPMSRIRYQIDGQIQFLTFPASTSFLTLSVSGFPLPYPGAGDTDSAVPFQISKCNYLKSQTAAPNDARIDRWEFNSLKFTGLALGQAGPPAWWSKAITPPTDDMAYECDSGLGSPSEVDCEQLEWSELGNPSDSISISPETPTFLHSKTCFLGISSASTSISLTWAQIRAAYASLLGICVQNPISSSQGGRAYYAPQPVPSFSGRRSRSRKRQSSDAVIKRQSSDNDDAITGLNALPPGITLSVFSQKEPWTNPAVEAKTCTWEAVLRKTAISTCPAS